MPKFHILFIMPDQRYLECIEAHNKEFPDRNIDITKAESKRGNAMYHFIKDLQIRLQTDPDGILGSQDKAALQKDLPLKKGQSYSFFPIIRWAMWCKGYKGFIKTIK